MHETKTIPMKTLLRPNTAVPMRYSVSRSGVTIMLSKLRVHVSSRKPVESARFDAKRMWKSSSPVRTVGTVLSSPGVLFESTTASEPKRIESIAGAATSNHR